MGTKQQTQQSGVYDPGSMGAFQGMTGPFAKAIEGYISNPFGNPFMQTQQQMGTNQAHNMGQTAMSGLTQNMTGSGMAGGASNPAGVEMMQNQARANSGMQANLGFLQPMQNALGMQQGAMQMAGNYHPLQTGQNTTQSTSGLGTWLPQLIGAGLGMAGGAAGGGGLGSLMKLFGQGGGGGNLFGNAGAGGYGGGFGGAGGVNWLGSGPGGGQNPGNFGGQMLGGSMPPPPVPWGNGS